MSMTNQNSFTDAEPANVLRILSGLHAGASRALAEQEMILVGSGEDCDIVLADQGVARHHVLINLTGGLSSLRALDAPVQVDGVPLHPGDPVELRGLQRIRIGEAAIAYGLETDPGWNTLLPMGADAQDAARTAKPVSRRLPVIAALAVLSLASLAIFAAVMPINVSPVDPDTQIKSLIPEYQIASGKISKNINGDPVLSGTVSDDAVRQRIAQRLQADGIVATLDLRTGEDIAADVSEILRSQKLNAKTRYLGNGVVEASGRFEDMDALRAAAQSRAMSEITGVTQVLARNYAEPDTIKKAGATTANPVPAVPVRIVSVVRGQQPHLVAIDGIQYPVGADLPGRGKLVSIGESAHVVSADGMLHKVVAQPVTSAELALAASQQAAIDASTVTAPASPATTAMATTTGNASGGQATLAKAGPSLRDRKKM